MGSPAAQRAPAATPQAVAARPQPVQASKPAPSLETPVPHPSGSTGAPLPPTTRQRMERAFGQSFGSVRVHDGTGAAAAAKQLDAEAFTAGNDIAFGADKFRPDTPDGDRVIAHELAHVVQQQGGGAGNAAVQPKTEVSNPAEPAEQEAEAAADRVMRGEPAAVRPRSHAPSTRDRLMRRALAGVALAPTVPVPVTAAEAAAAEAPVEDTGAGTDAAVPPPRRKRRWPWHSIDPQGDREPKKESAALAVPAERGTIQGAQPGAGVESKAIGGTGAEPLAAPLPSGARETPAPAVAAGETKAPETPQPEPPAADVKRAESPQIAAGIKRPESPQSAAEVKRPESPRSVAEVKPPESPRSVVEVKPPESPQSAAEVKRPKSPQSVAEVKRPESPQLAAGVQAETKGAQAEEVPAKPSTSETPEETPAAPAGGDLAAGRDESTKKAETPDRPKGLSPAAPGAAELAAPATTPPATAGKTEALPATPAAPAPAPAQAAPAAAKAGASGGAGSAPTISTGGDAEGAAADSPDAAATEEKMDAAQPEEEAAAEAIQEEGDGGGGGGGGAEPEAGADDAETPAASPAGAAKEPSAGGESAEGAAPAPETGEAEGSAAEQAKPTETATEQAEPAETAEQKNAREAEDAAFAQQGPASPEQAPSEEAALSPGEQEAAMGSLAEDSGGEGEPGGGGGGGGGGGIPDKPVPDVPDVSQAEPAAALGQLSGLPPAQLVQGLTGVSQAATRAVGEKRTELAANPPSLDTPTGMPGRPATARRAGATEGGAAKKPDKVPQGENAPTPPPEPTPAPPPAPATAIQAPVIQGGESGEMSSDQAALMGRSIEDMPTTDPALSTSAGEPPALALEGGADPGMLDSQQAEIDSRVAEAATQGQIDAAQPMGEDDISPQQAEGTLEASIEGGAGGAGGGPGGADVDEATSIVAEEEHGAEIQGAVQQGQGDIAAEEARHAESEQAERQASREETDRQIQQAEDEQRALKQGAREEVATKRRDWTEAQRAAVADGRTKADATTQETHGKVEAEKTQGETRARGHLEQGEREAEQAKRQGETEAEAHKERGKRESSGFLGWLASKAKAFFNSIKQGIQAAIKQAREAVKQAIDAAKKLAHEAIELARKAAIAAIRAAGDALMAIGDVVLAAFPEARAKFRRAIEYAVAAAEAEVNRIAGALQAGIQKLLDALGSFLDKALGLLEKGLLAVVDAVAATVQGAIKAAQAVVDALGTFAVLIADIAASPGQWISNLAASVVDGIKNHLWKALKTAISNWFNEKVESVLGLGKAIYNLLAKGGISLEKIGKMAWQALKAAIPPALIGILVEKLVAMIVPAAGAVMAIIEGIQAAWGTISKILQAIDLFITFLKSVKGGGAGPQFANAVAAGAVAVIDFVSNWLLLKLGKAAGKVAGKLKAIAQKIGKKVGKALKKVAKALKKAWRKIKKKLKKWFGKKKRKKDKKDKKKDKQKALEERLKKAVEAIRPALSSALSDGMARLILKAKLLYWRARHRLSRLTLLPDGTVEAAINPKKPVLTAKQLENIGAKLEPILVEVEQTFLAQWEETRPDDEQETFDEAVDTLEKGRKRKALGLHPFDRIVLLRGIERGDYKVKGQRGKKHPNIMPGDEHFSFTLKNKRNLNQYVEPGLSTYKKMLQEMKKNPSAFMGKKGERLKGLVQALEVARAPGMLPTDLISRGLVDANIMSEQDNLLKHPLAAEKSSIAGEPLREVEGKKRSKKEQGEIQKATQFRHKRIAEIFLSLRQALGKKKQSELMAGDNQSKALARLATAFETWIKAAFPVGKHKKSTAAEVGRALRALKAKLLAFMKTFR